MSFHSNDSFKSKGEKILKKVITGCTRDCPGGCSIIAKIEDNKLLKLGGNPDHDVTQGLLCPNTSRYLEEVFYSPKRILNPLIKEDGVWKPIEWNQAIEIMTVKISETVEEHGSSSIFYYQGFGSRTALKFLNKRFFNLLGGVSTLSGTICGGIGQAGQEMDFGVRVSHDPLDHLKSGLIIVWGRNPAVTDLHLWRILRKSQRNGTILVVIDPVKTKTAKTADIYLQPKPGSDSYLAIALSKVVLSNYDVDWNFIETRTQNFENFNEILENYTLSELSKKCKVHKDQIKNLVSLYTKNRPSSIITGWGMQRYKEGHTTFRMIDALAALAGNIGISGGGVSHGFEEYGFFNMNIQKNESGKNQRTISMPLVGEEILNATEPPIKMAVISSGNPVNLSPNSNKVKKAFQSIDFVVMIDHFLNDTSEVADMFLPATTFLEEDDLVGSYGHNWVSPVNMTVPPMGEAKSELEIFQTLADKLGFGDEMVGSPQYWLRKIASPILERGISFKEIQRGPVKMVSTCEIPYASGKFKTESGLFEFVKEFQDLEKELNNDFQIQIISTMPEKWLGSVVPESEKKTGYINVNVNPRTLQKYGLKNGYIAVLESKTGELSVKVLESEDVVEDVIQTYRGGWMKYGKNINVLTEDKTSQEGEGAPYHETRVKIRKLQ